MQTALNPQLIQAPASEAAMAEAFNALHTLGHSAFERANLEESAAQFQAALNLAEQWGDQQRADLAFCNLAGVEISHKAQDALDAATTNRLREILMRNEDAVNSRLAAYNLSRLYEFRKEPRKGLFYARIALDRSMLIGREDWVASSHNQIGNLLMAQSFFGEAAEAYERALSLHPGEAVGRRALIRTNIGYSCLVRGDVERGFTLLHQSLRELLHHPMPSGARKRGLMFAHLDLCYAHLEIDRPLAAIRHGRKGLALAEELDEADGIKNGLYLLGEAYQIAGEELVAHLYYSRLQREFYPNTAGVADFLLAIDVRKMINLRA
jgi:tetratricopeptide (TPR) repeat protein